MAFALKIIAKTKNGEEIQIEPSWWNKGELRNNYEFKKEVNFHYFDYVLFVNKQNFQFIKESQEKYRNKGIYEYKGWIEVNNRTEARLENLLNELHEDSIVKIWIYEWESGLS